MIDVEVSNDFRENVRWTVDAAVMPLAVHNKKQKIADNEIKALTQSKVRQRFR